MEQRKPVLPPRPVPPPRPNREGDVFPKQNIQNTEVQTNKKNDLQNSLQDAPVENQTNDLTNLQPENKTVLQKKAKQTKEKQKKQPKNAEPKQKKDKKFSPKKLVIALAVVFVLLAGAGTGTYFVLQNLKNVPLVLDGQLQVCQMSGKVYLVAEQADCEKYIFNITYQNHTSTLYQNDYILDITQFLQSGGSYKFSYCIQNQSPKTKSKPSAEKTFVYKKDLKTPVLKVQDDKLCWQAIDGATGYTLYFFDNLGELKYRSLQANNGLCTFKPDFEVGNYEFWLVATKQDADMQSQSSNHVNLQIFENEINIDSISVDRDNCLVTINLTNNTNPPTFCIYIGQQMFLSKQTETKNTYVIDLKSNMSQIPFGQSVSAKILSRGQFFLDGQICFE